MCSIGVAPLTQVTHMRNNLREVSKLQRDAIKENHCLIQWSPFDMRNFFSVLATPLTAYSNMICDTLNLEV